MENYTNFGPVEEPRQPFALHKPTKPPYTRPGPISEAVDVYLDRRCAWLEEPSRVQIKRSLAIVKAALNELGVTEIEQISPVTARDLVQMLSGSGESGGREYAPNTVYRVVTAFARAANLQGWYGQLAAEYLCKASRQHWKQNHRRRENSQLRHIAGAAGAAIANPDLPLQVRCLVGLTVKCRARTSELSRMTVDDLDLDNGGIGLPRGRSTRWRHLPDELSALLAEHVSKKKAGTKSALWTGANGRRLSAKRISEEVREPIAQALMRHPDQLSVCDVRNAYKAA